MMSIAKISRYSLIFILSLAGITHFLYPGEFVSAVPEPFMRAQLWVYLTGIFEVLGALGLLLSRFRRLTGWVLVFYFIALLPAHFEMLIINHEIFGISNRPFFIARIFFQLIPIFMAWKARESDDKGFWPLLDAFDQMLKNRWQQPYAWQSKWLWAASWYNVGFGFWVVVFPEQAFELLNMDTPAYLFIWQTVGMIVGVYSIGYGIAALDELKHYPIVLVGFLGKIFGPIGFFYTWLSGEIALSFGLIILFNDLIWYPAFGAMLWRKWQEVSD